MSSIADQIAEMQRKLQLLEGDRKAFFEKTEFAKKKNKERILQLRKDNKELRGNLADMLSGDEKVISKAFQGREHERAALKNMSGPQAVSVLDMQVSDLKKKLNAVCSQKRKKEKRTEELKTKHEEMVKDASEAQQTDEGESDSAQRMRQIENSLDKANLKITEAETIQRTYEKIKSCLLQEGRSYMNQLDELETQIRNYKRESEELKNKNRDAQAARDKAKEDLSKQEELVYKERKEREQRLQELRKQADEKRAQAEKIEKRQMQRNQEGSDEMATSSQVQNSDIEVNREKIQTYEEAFERIKEATGVVTMSEVVRRFETQDATYQHLLELKEQSSNEKSRLEEEKQRLEHEFQEMKYSGEAKLSVGEKLLEDYQKHLKEEETRRDQAAKDAHKLGKTLNDTKAGVEYLHEKLQHLKLAKGHVPTAQVPPTSDEYVLDLLSICEEKLMKLLEELEGHSLADVLKEMEQEALAEGKMPPNNTRVKLPSTEKENVYGAEESDSGDDEDVLSRNVIKKQAQNIIDMKTKRRHPKKGGKKKK